RRHDEVPDRSALARLPAVQRVLPRRQRRRPRRKPPDRLDRPRREPDRRMATVTRVAVAVLIAAFIVPASAPVSAQSGVPRAPRTGLLVTVTDDDGRPVGGVTVALSGGGHTLTQATGADGVARFADLAPGDYDVTI